MKSCLYTTAVLFCSIYSTGCQSSDEDYFRRTTERRTEDLAAAAAVVLQSQELDDVDELLTFAVNDGLIPIGDSDSLRKDAWGTAIRLEKSENGRVVIRSAGEDRVFSTSDDVSRTIATSD